MAINIFTARVTMTGSAVSYTIPDKVREIKFQALSGDITVHAVSGGTVFYTIKQYANLPFNTRASGTDFAGQVLYCTGTNTHVLDVIYTTAL